MDRTQQSFLFFFKSNGNLMVKIYFHGVRVKERRSRLKEKKNKNKRSGHYLYDICEILLLLSPLSSKEITTIPLRFSCFLSRFDEIVFPVSQVKGVGE